MKTILLLIFIFTAGCMTIPAHESVISYEKFEVEKKCFSMVVLHVDSCNSYSKVCQGYISPKGTKEIFYAMIRKGTPQGGISKNCYIIKKETGDIISEYLM